MYQIFQNPWIQTDINKSEFSLSSNNLCNFIKKYKIKLTVEFNCGLGESTNFNREKTGVKIIGIDVSETAINKNKFNSPNLNLIKDDISEKIFSIMRSMFRNKYLLLKLIFLKLNQMYGLEKIKNFDQLIKFYPFKLLGKSITDYENSVFIKNLVIIII